MHVSFYWLIDQISPFIFEFLEPFNKSFGEKALYIVSYT